MADGDGDGQQQGDGQGDGQQQSGGSGVTLEDVQRIVREAVQGLGSGAGAGAAATTPPDVAAQVRSELEKIRQGERRRQQSGASKDAARISELERQLADATSKTGGDGGSASKAGGTGKGGGEKPPVTMRRLTRWMWGTEEDS